MDDKGTAPNVCYRIRKIRKCQKLSLRALSESCGLSANAISLMGRGEFANRFITAPFGDSAGGAHNRFLPGRDRGKRHPRQTSPGFTLPKQLNNPRKPGHWVAQPAIINFRMTVAPGVDNLKDPIAAPGEEFIHYQKGRLSTGWETGSLSYMPATACCLTPSRRTAGRIQIINQLL